MTAAFPVRHYLTEISGDSARQLSDAARVGRNAAADEQERLEDARMRGVMEGRAAADVEHGAALAAQKAAFEAKLAREREQWAAAEGARLAELLNAGLTDIEQKISDCVGRVLKPVVAADVRRAAVLRRDALRARGVGVDHRHELHARGGRELLGMELPEVAYPDDGGAQFGRHGCHSSRCRRTPRPAGAS